MATVLFVLAETLRCIGIVLQPFMPDTMSKLLDQLATPPDKRSFSSLNAADGLVSGAKLPAPQGLFPRIVETAGA
jgi:methionyl-tRNA synthetase